ATLPVALVVAPTRELAMQVKRELIWLYADTKASVASCVGGMDMRDERRNLERGAHIVVATPGRLRDHITRGSINLTDIKAVVLDEADEMLDLGFREDLEFILEAAPTERQTLLFSATVPPQIAKLAKSYQRDAERITTTAERSQHSDITYKGMTVSPQDSENAIINVLRYFEAPNALVFCNTRGMVNRLTTRLSNRGFSVVALSGELSQNDRTHALQAMRDGRARVCVATDVAARGIDLPNLDLVVHAELPSSEETLLHRSGRTGRAGRKGTCALIVPPRSRKKAERILKFAKVKATWGNAPSAEEVKAKDLERLLADPDWHEPIENEQAKLVHKLTETFGPEQIAAAYLRLYQSKHTAPEELSSVEQKPARSKEDFGPSVWFSLSEGRNHNVDPRRLLPMLCNAGGLTKGDIGAIRIQREETYVEIAKAKVADFLKTVGTEMIVENGASLTQLDKAPKLDSAPPRGRDRNDRGARDGGRGGRDGNRRDRGDRPDRNRPERNRPERNRSEGGHSGGAGRNDRRNERRDEGQSHSPASEKPWERKHGKGGDRDRSEKPFRENKFKPRTQELEADARPDRPEKSHKAEDTNAPRAPKRDKGKGKSGNPSVPTPKGKANSKKNKARAAAKLNVAAANKGEST
ncbi:MAG: DEAD/DEAH box helicase, partial [Alphaproteobacteria bacterium]